MNPNHYFNFDLIFFDCDSTLSSIEGIDELAKLADKEAEIAELTNLAMDGKIDLSEVYGKRLALIQPTRAQLAQVEQRYWETQVEDAKAVIDALQFLKKQVFIISGGLAQPVKGFAYRLGIPPERVRAVELAFNALSGEWWQYHDPSKLAQQKFMDYYEGDLTISSGKPNVVTELAQGLHGKRLFVGDGASDLATRSVVDLFVGFGGVVARDNVRKGADVWLESQSLAPILPIATGALGYARCVGTPHQAVFERGIALTQTHLFRIQQQTIQNAFEEAFALL